VVIGEGYERPALEALRDELGATDWVSMPGHVSDDELVSWYRRAWVVASSSQREGWGMTLTEAAACGTPSVATRIAGHEDAVLDGESGLLVSSGAELVEATGSILGDPMLRRRLSLGALRRAEQMTWERTAEVALQTLAAQVIRKR
jgi:glycosyltransferase involved in cell wall biosynthesis